MKLSSQALLGLRDGVLPRIEVLVRSWLACVRERRKEDKQGCGDDVCVRVVSLYALRRLCGLFAVQEVKCPTSSCLKVRMNMALIMSKSESIVVVVHCR